ncbi:MAG: DUF5050 domain-containing protein [Eubacteriales bacterium]|nr:DUF5050 domain-containing protein [Eubacteriales bacterium]
MKKGYCEDTGGTRYTSGGGKRLRRKKLFRARTALAVSMILVLMAGIMVSGCGAKTSDAGAAPVQAAETESDSQDKGSPAQAEQENAIEEQSGPDAEAQTAGEDTEAASQADTSDQNKTASNSAEQTFDSVANQYASAFDKAIGVDGDYEQEIKSSIATADASQFETNPQYSAVTSNGWDSVPFEMSGTTSGNFFNFGEFAFYEDKVLYVSNGNLMCADPGMRNPSVVRQGVYGNLNVVGNICFYTSLDRSTIKACWIDGSRPEEVDLFHLDSSYVPKSLCVIGQWIYFTANEALYRFSIDDTSTAYFVTDGLSSPFFSMCTLNGKLLCSGRDGSVIMMEPDGSNKTLVTNRKGNFISDGNSVFMFTNDQKQIYRIDINGSSVSENLILDLNDDSGETDLRVRSLNCSDGWLYHAIMYEGSYLLSRQKVTGDELYVYDMICQEPDTLVSMGSSNDSDYVYFFTINSKSSDGSYMEDHFPMDITIVN